VDIGLLYDPVRPSEKRFCSHLKPHLEQSFPRWRIRRNVPYRGRDEGCTSWLRTQFGDRSYLGIELEINQRLFRGEAKKAAGWIPALVDTVCEACRMNIS
jgi:hypothetical protein